MKHINLIKTLLATLLLSSPMMTWAEDGSAAPAQAASEGGVEYNVILMIIAIFLLFPIYVTSKTFLFSVKEKMKKTNSDTLKALTIGLLTFSSTAAFAGGGSSGANSLGLVLLGIILLEVLLIIYFSIQSVHFLKGITGVKEETSDERSGFEVFWDKINSFKPMSEEANIDTGHSYDGIRELDNVTPPWFTYSFLFSIVFAVFYLYRYHVAHSAPLMIEEYKMEMAAAEAESKKSAGKGSSIDENNVALLGEADIAEGKKKFVEVCAACHGANAASSPAGVGPNLTDNNWIHGGSIKEIFKSIKYGWPDKGMISWKDQMSSKQMAQLASFIKSVAGTNVAGGKAPQGDPYKEEAAAAPDAKATSATKDTTAAKSATPEAKPADQKK